MQQTLAVVRWFKHFSSWHKLKNYGKRQEVLTSHNLLPKLKFSTCISCLFLFKAASLLGTPTVAISPKKSNTCRNPSIKPQNTNTKSRVAKVFQQKKTFNLSKMHRRATPQHRCAWGIGPSVGSAPAPPSTPSPSNGIKSVPRCTKSVTRCQAYVVSGNRFNPLFKLVFVVPKRSGLQWDQVRKAPCLAVASCTHCSRSKMNRLFFHNVTTQEHPPEKSRRNRSRTLKTTFTYDLSQYYDHAFELSSLSDMSSPPLSPDPPIKRSSMTSMPFRASPHFVKLCHGPFWLAAKSVEVGKLQSYVRHVENVGVKNWWTAMNSASSMSIKGEGGIVPECTNFANIAPYGWLLRQPL